MEQPAVEKHLKSLLSKFEPYALAQKEELAMEKDRKGFIVQKLLRKRFRKQKVHPDTAADINGKIDRSIKGQNPLHFIIPFGGYKHFWNPSHPYPDWAELFTLRFLTEWVVPILAVHKPGVIMEFISEGVIVPRMNNYPEEAIEQYSQGFTTLLDTYCTYAPPNFDIRFFRIQDRYDKDKLIEEVEKRLPEKWKRWDTYSDAQRVVELKRSRRSVLWKGKEDLTKLSEQEKEKRIIESRLLELAYYEVESSHEFLDDYFIEDNHIPICFSFGLSPDNMKNPWLTLGSTYASTVDFWIGRGILEERTDRFIHRIVSREQYEKIKDCLQNHKVNLDLLPMSNYQSIEVISRENWSTRF